MTEPFKFDPNESPLDSIACIMEERPNIERAEAVAVYLQRAWLYEQRESARILSGVKAQEAFVDLGTESPNGQQGSQVTTGCDSEKQRADALEDELLRTLSLLTMDRSIFNTIVDQAGLLKGEQLVKRRQELIALNAQRAKAAGEPIIPPNVRPRGDDELRDLKIELLNELGVILVLKEQYHLQTGTTPERYKQRIEELKRQIRE